MKEISFAANLSQRYTNHCIRATSLTLLDRVGIPVHRIMQVSGHRNEGSLKAYSGERQTLQQKQSSEILATPVASSMALITKSPEQVENRNSASCQNMFTNTNLSTLGTPGLKSIISLSLITRQRKVMIDL